MAETRQQASLATGIWESISSLHFFQQFRANIAAAGLPRRKTLVGFALAWLIFFLILFGIPAPAGLSPAGKATLAVVAWACTIWVFEALPAGVSGLLIPMLLVMSGAAKPFSKAAEGFVTPVAFLCLSAFIFAAIMQAAGLDRRIALSLLNWMKVKTVNGVIWAMFAVNVVLSLVIPAANARAAALLPVINGITKFFGDSREERDGKKAIVIQTLVYGSMISGMCIMTAHLPNLVVIGLFEKNLGLRISYFDWFLLQWPYLGMFALTQWWVQRYFKTRGVAIAGGFAAVQKQRRELPRTTQSEWLILLVFGLIALAWMTEQWHMVASHIIRLGMLSNVAAVTMLAPVLLAMAPKLGLHPVAFTMLVADTDSFAYILPTQITAAVIAYSSGTFNMTDYAKVGWVSVLIAIAYGIVVMAPWYALLGIPVWDPTAPWPFSAAS